MALPIRTRPRIRISLSLQETYISLLSYLSEGRQSESYNHRKLIKLIKGPQPCLTQWNYEPCHVGPPKMDASWWTVLTKRGSVEKGVANQFSILT